MRRGEIGTSCVRMRAHWRSTNLRCWRMALVASAEGGVQVARDFFRHRSASEERMLITTVRLSGWLGLDVLNSLACARCCSLAATLLPGRASSVPAGAGPMSWPSADCCAAQRMTSCGIIRVCCMAGDISLVSVRMDILSGSANTATRSGGGLHSWPNTNNLIVCLLTQHSIRAARRAPCARPGATARGRARPLRSRHHHHHHHHPPLVPREGAPDAPRAPPRSRA